MTTASPEWTSEKLNRRVTVVRGVCSRTRREKQGLQVRGLGQGLLWNKPPVDRTEPVSSPSPNPG